MSQLCGNCEEREAFVECDQCHGSDALFCSACWDIHPKVKCFRGHTSHPITSPSSGNSPGLKLKEGPSTSLYVALEKDGEIDENTSPNDPSGLNIQELKLRKEKSNDLFSLKKKNSTLTRSNCNDFNNAVWTQNSQRTKNTKSDRYLNDSDECKSVSQELSKKISSSDLKEDAEPFFFFEYIDNVIETCSNVSDNGDLNMNTILYGFIAALAVHVIARVVFGKMSIFAVVGLGVALVAMVRKKQNVLSMEISKLQDANSEYRSEMRALCTGKNSTSDPENSIWQSLVGDNSTKSIKFRPRVRPYQMRNKSSPANKKNV